MKFPLDDFIGGNISRVQRRIDSQTLEVPLTRRLNRTCKVALSTFFFGRVELRRHQKELSVSSWKVKEWSLEPLDF